MLSSMDLEERILNGASLFAFISVFMPWLSGEWLGEDFVSYSGFRFFTAAIGITFFLLHLVQLSISLSPMFGGPQLVRGHRKDVVRLCLTVQATILSLAALSVLTSITYDYTRMEIRFGIYCAFIGSLVSAFYSFWKMQEHNKAGVPEIFHHPDTVEAAPEPHPVHHSHIPPPPPPPPLEPEEFKMRP